MKLYDIFPNAAKEIAWRKRAKAKRHNPKASKTRQGTWDPFGGMLGYSSNQGKDFVAPYRDGIA